MGQWVTSPAYRAAVEVLVAAREDAGLTQRQLAARLGKERAPSFIAKIERGERRVDLIEFVAILRALGVDELRALADVLARLPQNLEV